MKKIAILLEDFVEETEFIYPLFRFKEAGFETVVLAPEKREYKGKNGLKFSPDRELKEGDSSIFDGVFIPGGYAPDRLRRSQKVLNFVKEVYLQGKPVMSICHGPWVLISAGILKGKKVTGYFAIKDDIINAGAVYTGKPFEKDGNIYTATDPKAMPEFFRFLIAELSDTK